MPILNWSPGALAALRSENKREEITRLFEAYFRVAGNDTLLGTALYLDLPTESRNRYHFLARFKKTKGWVVEAELKHEHRKVRFSRAAGADS
jgi:hypothetical protein